MLCIKQVAISNQQLVKILVPSFYFLVSVDYEGAKR